VKRKTLTQSIYIPVYKLSWA